MPPKSSQRYYNLLELQRRGNELLDMYVALADLYVHDQDLNSAEFRQLMLCLVQDVYTKPGVSRSAPDINFRDEFF